jgi:hypothetical protein
MNYKCIPRGTHGGKFSEVAVQFYLVNFLELSLEIVNSYHEGRFTEAAVHFEEMVECVLRHRHMVGS